MYVYDVRSYKYTDGTAGTVEEQLPWFFLFPVIALILCGENEMGIVDVTYATVLCRLHPTAAVVMTW